jgi:hypothetical protein
MVAPGRPCHAARVAIDERDFESIQRRLRVVGAAVCAIGLLTIPACILLGVLANNRYNDAQARRGRYRASIVSVIGSEYDGHVGLEFTWRGERRVETIEVAYPSKLSPGPAVVLVDPDDPNDVTIAGGPYDAPHGGILPWLVLLGFAMVIAGAVVWTRAARRSRLYRSADWRPVVGLTWPQHPYVVYSGRGGSWWWLDREHSWWIVFDDDGAPGTAMVLHDTGKARVEIAPRLDLDTTWERAHVIAIARSDDRVAVRAVRGGSAGWWEFAAGDRGAEIEQLVRTGATLEMLTGPEGCIVVRLSAAREQFAAVRIPTAEALSTWPSLSEGAALGAARSAGARRPV